MGVYIRDAAKAASDIKELATSLGGDVRVTVIGNPFEVKVEFMERSRYNQLIPFAGFTLVQQVNCCGVLVSTQTFVASDRQGQHIAQDMMPLKEAIARKYGYSALVATVNITGNPAEVHILKKCGWAQQYQFKNERTGNQVGFFFKSLEKK